MTDGSEKNSLETAVKNKSGMHVSDGIGNEFIRFSILITCYNQERFIREAVDSALAQECANKEVIVVDDASTDGSKEILEHYGDAIRFIALGSNVGAPKARNRAAVLARGDFFVFLDGDDLLLPWALTIYSRIIDVKAPKLIVGSMWGFSESFSLAKVGGISREIRMVEYEGYLKKDRPYRVSPSAMVIERRCFYNVDGFSPDAWPSDDWELLIKLGYSGRTIHIIAPQTTAYRYHANNVGSNIKGLIDALYFIISREKSGRYPGGRASRSERYAVIGGAVFFWFKRTLRRRLYGECLKLLIVGFPMILSAIFYRGLTIVSGRRPVEVIRGF